MRKFLYIFLLVCGCWDSTKSDGLLHVYVDRVIDGDTFVLKDGRRARLIGIDTPETVHPRKSSDPHGYLASNYLKSLIEKNMVIVTFDKQKQDKYGRLLVYVFFDGVFVNADLIKRGYGKAVFYYPNTRYKEYFIVLEKLAKQQRIGVWGNN